mmetsp:Transcript_43594/g.123341  ORF Transcript_43594/g.123341 Transcript_43594/m.123341 type:complete len:347 (+) Transcript_43594:865-1905(+)
MSSMPSSMHFCAFSWSFCRASLAASCLPCSSCTACWNCRFTRSNLSPICSALATISWACSISAVACGEILSSSIFPSASKSTPTGPALFSSNKSLLWSLSKKAFASLQPFMHLSNSSFSTTSANSRHWPASKSTRSRSLTTPSMDRWRRALSNCCASALRCTTLSTAAHSSSTTRCSAATLSEGNFGPIFFVSWSCSFLKACNVSTNGWILPEAPSNACRTPRNSATPCSLAKTLTSSNISLASSIFRMRSLPKCTRQRRCTNFARFVRRRPTAALSRALTWLFMKTFEWPNANSAFSLPCSPNRLVSIFSHLTLKCFFRCLDDSESSSHMTTPFLRWVLAGSSIS